MKLAYFIFFFLFLNIKWLLVYADNTAETDKKVFLVARKNAKQLLKEGWKPYPNTKDIEEQQKELLLLQLQADENGDNVYIVEDVLVSHNNLEDAEKIAHTKALALVSIADENEISGESEININKQSDDGKYSGDISSNSSYKIQAGKKVFDYKTPVVLYKREKNQYHILMSVAYKKNPPKPENMFDENPMTLQDSIRKFAFGVNVVKNDKVMNHSYERKNEFDDFQKEIYQEFYSFQRNAHKDFRAFRKKINKEYASFMRNPWKEFVGKKTETIPKEETVPPVVKPLDVLDDSVPKSRPFPIKEIIRQNVHLSKITPIYPIREDIMKEDKNVQIKFFGTDFLVRYNNDKPLVLSAVDEKHISRYWEYMSAEFDNLLFDCLCIRDKHNLCDWAYLLFLQNLSEQLCVGKKNEANLLMAYLFCQSGYQMRLAHDKGRIYMLYACENIIYNKDCYELDAHKYYSLDQLPQRLHICETKFPKEQVLSLSLTQPLLIGNRSEVIERSMSMCPNAVIKTVVNKNIIDFYATYPSSSCEKNNLQNYSYYANLPLEKCAKEVLYPQLKELIKGKNQIESADILLNWVQTGFKYEFDSKLWGGDRIFFPDESLFYPYCDCEDRAILYTRLIRDLLGLECVLVYYPGHLASAVEFTENVNGDYVEYEGKKYTICDPTYINSSIGYTMPNMNNATATIVLLK